MDRQTDRLALWSRADAALFLGPGLQQEHGSGWGGGRNVEISSRNTQSPHRTASETSRVKGQLQIFHHQNHGPVTPNPTRARRVCRSEARSHLPAVCERLALRAGLQTGSDPARRAPRWNFLLGLPRPPSETPPSEDRWFALDGRGPRQLEAGGQTHLLVNHSDHVTLPADSQPALIHQ